MIILTVFTAEIQGSGVDCGGGGRGRAGDWRKKNKNCKSVFSFFLPTAKQSRNLNPRKIKRITTTVRRAMTWDNVLACTKPKNRYIQQHKKRSRTVEADRK